MRIQSILLPGLVLVCAAVIAMAASPQPPKTIAYQGRLTNSGGTPVADGSYNLNFAIWNDPTSTSLSNKKWESGSVSVTVTGGLFNVNLGAPGQTVLPDSIFLKDTNLYLGTSVNGGAEMTPRTKLTSVAYAYVAGTVPDSSLYSTKIINETGLTDAMYPGSIAITYNASALNSDIATISITTPGGGFIVVDAFGQVGFNGTVGFPSRVSLQIDQTAGGFDDQYFYYWLGTDSWNLSGWEYNPVALRRVYYMFAAGTYTFRLEGRKVDNYGSAYFWSPVMSATYYPTYYGLLAKSSSGAHIDTAYVDGEVPVRSAQPPAKQPPAGIGN